MSDKEKAKKSKEEKESDESEEDDELLEFTSHINDNLESLSSRVSLPEVTREILEETSQEQSQQIFLSSSSTRGGTDFQAPTKFVAPVLEPSQDSLEQTTQSAPAATFQPTQNTEVSTGGNVTGYTTRSDYAGSESSKRSYQPRRREEIFEPERRFDIREGLIADTDLLAPNDIQRTDDGFSPRRIEAASGDDLALFDRHQREYETKRDQSRDEPFMKRRRI